MCEIEGGDGGNGGGLDGGGSGGSGGNGGSGGGDFSLILGGGGGDGTNEVSSFEPATKKTIKLLIGAKFNIA